MISSKWLRYVLLFLTAFLYIIMSCTTLTLTSALAQSTLVANQVETDTSWSWLSDLFKRREGDPQGSRGDRFCGISPGMLDVNNKPIWNNRPFFIWQGEASQIHVKSLENPLTWEKTVTGINFVEYDAAHPLQPGLYTWWIDDKEPESILFEISSTEEREQVKADLRAISAEGNTEETRQKRLTYFAEKFLWADILSDTYAIDNPPPALQAIKTEIMNNLVASLCSGRS
jgi:hypothetical protein